MTIKITGVSKKLIVEAQIKLFRGNNDFNKSNLQKIKKIKIQRYVTP